MIYCRDAVIRKAGDGEGLRPLLTLRAKVNEVVVCFHVLINLIQDYYNMIFYRLLIANMKKHLKLLILLLIKRN